MRGRKQRDRPVAIAAPLWGKEVKMAEYIDLGYDIAEVETRSPSSIVPDGDYVVAVTNASVQDSKSSGQPTLYATLEIVEGPYAGSIVRDFMPLSKDAAFRFKQFLTALLGRAPEGRKVPGPEWYVGRRLVAMVRQSKDYQGITRSQPIGYRAALKADVPNAKEVEVRDDEVDFG